VVSAARFAAGAEPSPPPWRQRTPPDQPQQLIRCVSRCIAGSGPGVGSCTGMNAGMLAFMLSDEAPFITGQVLSISGGLTMHGYSSRKTSTKTQISIC
jgi:hypothetical protein